tara:strand:+ start:555 stop:1952 length:1398 start_codon:yes stop_codon:yes gene_type:complete
MNCSKYDINIDNYDEEELLQILKINIPIESLTVSQLKTHMNVLLNPLSSSSSYDEIIYFFQKAAERIENIIQRNQNSITIDSSIISASTLSATSLTSNSNLDTEIVESSNHPVILPHYPSAINTNKTPYPEGTLNPIQKKTITKIINIDSIFRPNYDNTTSTNFMWNLIQRETNVVSMRVSSVDIPVLWHAITDKMNRNEFRIHLYNMNGLPDIEQTIIIPPGNYISDTFTNMLNLIFKKQAGGLQYLIAEVDSVSSRTIIRAVDKDDIIADSIGLTTHAAFDPANAFYAPDFFFTIDFFPQLNKYSSHDAEPEFQRTVAWYMGFRKYKYKIEQSNLVQHILYDPFHNSFYYECGVESESSYSSSRDNYIFLNIDDYNSNCVCQPIVSSTKDSYIGNNILARITVDTIHNTVLYDNGADLIFKERVYMGPVTIEKMKISLINRYGDIIDLNYNDLSFTLELTKLY